MSQKIPPFPEKVKKPNLLKRLFIGSIFLSLGMAVVVIGIISIDHRISYFVVETGAINGRILRLRAPIDGKIEAFFPRPGVLVKQDQILARIQRSHEVEQGIVQLKGDMQSKSNQLVAAEESLAFLQKRLQKQENEYDRLWDVEQIIDAKEVEQKQAVLAQALAQAQAALSDYQRFEYLYKQGGVTKQQLERATAAWKIAVAEVRRAKEDFESAQVALRAARERVAMNEYPNWGDSFVEETTQLRQQIQDQRILINTLKAEVEIAQERLTKAQSLYSDRQNLEIKAPLAAVVYSTEREQGEFVKESEELLSLLDCNDIWVETIVSAKDAIRINAHKPVRVQLAGHPEEEIPGEVDLIQAISRQSDYERSQRLQVQALLPTLDPELLGKPLSRVTIKISPPQKHAHPKNFCGLGIPARLTFATEKETLLSQLKNLYRKIQL